MATRASFIQSTTDDRVPVVTWGVQPATPLLTTDVGEAVQMGRFYDLTVQVVGTFGAAGTVSIQGSNDGGTTWGLIPIQGVTVVTTIADSASYKLLTSPALIRPSINGGDGTTSLKVYIAGAIRSF